MSDEQHMSKYARKVAARREEQASRDRTLAAIDFALRVTEGKVEVKPKPAHNPPKNKQQPPEPRGALADLGGLPEACAACLRNAAAQLRTALGIAYEIQARAKRGRQAGEAFAVVGIIGQLPDRAEYGARRVAEMPNAPQGGEDRGQ